jgi:hypothetical protein
VDYEHFINIFLCKDTEELKARLAFLCLEGIESKTYYEVGDSWIEDEKLKKRVLIRVLYLQEDLIEEYGYLIQSIDQCQNSTKERLLLWLVACLIDFLQTKKELMKAQEIYINYPEKEDENGKDIHPYKDEYIKKWLKKKFIQSKYKS